VHDPEAFLPLKPQTLEILLALAREDLHGYAILKVLEERGVRLAASLLYRKLRRLMEDGLVAESSGRRAPEDDARRRYYRLTPLGREVVAAEAARIVGLARSGPIRRLAREAAEGGRG
jgi:DNA-binding PadR family transcriptional regulator